MRHCMFVLLTLTLLAGNRLGAQDSATPAPRAPELRRRIEERFAVRIKEQLGLSNEQMARLRATTVKFGGRRRELEGRQLAVRRALQFQLRPGTAANQDSVAKLTDDLLSGRVAYAQTYRDEAAELKGYLNPVQRAQVIALRERLLRRAQQFRERQGGLGEDPRGRRRPLMER